MGIRDPPIRWMEAFRIHSGRDYGGLATELPQDSVSNVGRPADDRLSTPQADWQHERLVAPDNRIEYQAALSHGPEVVVNHDRSPASRDAHHVTQPGYRYIDFYHVRIRFRDDALQVSRPAG